jgi:hypothetical protein
MWWIVLVIIIFLGAAGVFAIAAVATGGDDSRNEPPAGDAAAAGDAAGAGCKNGGWFYNLGKNEEEARAVLVSNPALCSVFNFTYHGVDGVDGKKTALVEDADKGWGCCRCPLAPDQSSHTGVRCDLPATNDACNFYIPGRSRYDAQTLSCVCADGYCDGQGKRCGDMCRDCEGRGGCDKDYTTYDAQQRCHACQCLDGEEFSFATLEGKCETKVSKNCVSEDGTSLQQPDTQGINRIKVDVCSEPGFKYWEEVANKNTVELSSDGPTLQCTDSPALAAADARGGACLRGVEWDAGTSKYQCYCAGCADSEDSEDERSFPDENTSGVSSCCAQRGGCPPSKAEPPPTACSEEELEALVAEVRNSCSLEQLDSLDCRQQKHNYARYCSKHSVLGVDGGEASCCKGCYWESDGGAVYCAADENSWS